MGLLTTTPSAPLSLCSQMKVRVLKRRSRHAGHGDQKMNSGHIDGVHCKTLFYRSCLDFTNFPAYAHSPAVATAPFFFWFRRDLRDYDNASLCHALKSARKVFRAFIFDRDSR